MSYSGPLSTSNMNIKVNLIFFLFGMIGINGIDGKIPVALAAKSFFDFAKVGFAIARFSTAKARHKEVLNGLRENKIAIEKVEKEVRQLGLDMKREHIETRLFDPIQTLLSITSFAALTPDAAMRETKELCDIKGCPHVLRTVVDGMENYMDKLYKSSDVNGHFPEMDRIITNLLKFIATSIEIIQTVEDVNLRSYLEFEQKAAALEKFLTRAKNDNIKIKENIDKEARGIRFLAPLVGNKGFVDILFLHLEMKFAWLRFAVFVYNDIKGWDNHTWRTKYPLSRVDIFRVSGMNAVIVFCQSSFTDQLSEIAGFGIRERKLDAFVKRYEGLWFKSHKSLHLHHHNGDKTELWIFGKA